MREISEALIFPSVSKLVQEPRRLGSIIRLRKSGALQCSAAHDLRALPLPYIYSCPTGGGDPPVVARSLARACQLKRTYQLKRTFPLQPMNSNCATTIMASQLIVEPYQVTESRIKQVIDILSDRGDDNLNLAAAAREFRVPVKRWRARWAGQQSKQERPGTNKRLSEGEELAVFWFVIFYIYRAIPKPKAYDSTPSRRKKRQEKKRKEILIPASALWESPVLPLIYK